MNRRLWRATLAVAIAITPAALLSTPAQAAEPVISLGQVEATFAQQSSWGTAYVGVFTITNRLESPSAWKLDFDLPAGTGIEHIWGARLTRTDDHYTAVGEDWNASLQPFASTNLGFITTGTGQPLRWRINDGPCAGSGCAPDVQPPTTPGNLHLTSDPITTRVLWTASSDNVGVARYEVYLSFGKPPTTPLGTTTGTEFDTPNLPLSPAPSAAPAVTTHYLWMVRAFDAAGNASPYAIVDLTGITDSTPPSSPSDLTLDANSGSVTFRWKPATDDVMVAGYDVYIDDKLVGSTSDTSLTVRANNPGETTSIVAFDGVGHRSSPLTRYWPVVG